MERTKILTRVVLITAAITVGALGIAALIGLGTGMYRAGYVGPGSIPIDESRTLALDGVDSVTIDVVSEGVRVVEGSGDVLVARLHGSAAARSPDNRPKLTVERSGSSVIIHTELEWRFTIGFSWSSLDLDVTVPRGFAQKLSVKTVSGGVRIADHAFGGLSLSTTSGDVEVGTVSAPDFSMHSTSGTLSAASVAAQRVDLSSTSGDIRIKGLTGDTTLHTISGDVSVAYAAVPGRIDAVSTSGTITLKLPADAQFLLDARSTSGDIRCRFPITINQTSRGGGNHRLAGAVGTGNGQVTVHTTSGDIHIEN